MRNADPAFFIPHASQKTIPIFACFIRFGYMTSHEI